MIASATPRTDLRINDWIVGERERQSRLMTMRGRFQHHPLALLRGAALLSFTAIAWGGMLRVAKPMLVTLDRPWLNGIRYAIAALLFAAILVHVEGRRALSFEGQALQAAVLGTVGFAGFGIVARSLACVARAPNTRP